eukprot:CAMPEP_0202694122 /NCGR_PEP_ID=MMETSP1385-20130828/8064_1 /ASSEMBLY_ACC=CAM_ASM_000861 /TAXON_ID=933848 /ORGANISM="Elphidium margaritaceum" /LENGTH=221 /DNA_ID=CAMNT_0049349905 /DNA_START=127 /DNA_END=792 /DNA_ORIENTATION=+
MDDPLATGWQFNNTVYNYFGQYEMYIVVEDSNVNLCCSDVCTTPKSGLEDHGSLTRSWFLETDDITSVQLRFCVGARHGFKVSYKWSIDGNWTRLYWGDPFEVVFGPVRGSFDPITDIPLGHLDFSVRIEEYTGSSTVYVDDFYLLANMSSCPTTTAALTTQDTDALTTEELEVLTTEETEALTTEETEALTTAETDLIGGAAALRCVLYVIYFFHALWLL